MGLLSRFNRERDKEDDISNFHLVKRSTEGNIVETGLVHELISPSRKEFPPTTDRSAISHIPLSETESLPPTPSPTSPQSVEPQSEPARRSHKLKAFSNRFKKEKVVEREIIPYLTVTETSDPIDIITQSFPCITLTESFKGNSSHDYYNDRNNSKILLETPSFKSDMSSESSDNSSFTSAPPLTSSSGHTTKDDDDQWVKRAEYMVIADSHHRHDLPSSQEEVRSRSSSPTKRHRISRLFSIKAQNESQFSTTSSITPTIPTISMPTRQGPIANDGGRSRSQPNTPTFENQPFVSLPTSPGNLKRSSIMLNSTMHDLVESQLLTAIDLHESGQLTAATTAFSQLADPDESIPRPGVPLAQVLYGMSLRHGWGCEPDQVRALEYLRAGAANSAIMDLAKDKDTPNSSTNSENFNSDEDTILEKRRAMARKDMMLAIYELGNCFQYGWGTPIDANLALSYYETAARLGDPDAMLSAAWCYLEGFGLKKKDKYMAAQYYRMAEKAGRGEVGTSWIWKEKYDKKD
ncbi:hypothetical protein NADFUDRAFT_84446 [Nadsonia fulvescens var. elongata DSM 6958]|uniref:HCP-like protein n=1 Tax=Nadsonia fulvescens var. elongata DSM 6958 TaxID=857566 RepID=A0A1E3PDJ1_9ASCO|nr:hypothetical protein NADFUDRAFT_84446 [Nadsonia fulvescens var. elongata DSM 6958]